MIIWSQYKFDSIVLMFSLDRLALIVGACKLSVPSGQTANARATVAALSTLGGGYGFSLSG